MSKYSGRILFTLLLSGLLLLAHGAMSTDKPLIAATETITVPDVHTGEPMELEVEVESSSSAEAAAYVYSDCRKRLSKGLRATYGGYTHTLKCGATQGSGYNGITEVWDTEGPICVYYSGVLAGCGSKGQRLWVGNRGGATATLATQPIGS